MAAPSFWPLALPAVTVDSGSLLQADGTQRGEVLEGGLGARVLVAVDDDVGLAAPAGDGDRDELVGEPAGLVGGARLAAGSGWRARPAPRGRWRTPGGGSRRSRASRRGRGGPCRPRYPGPVEPVHQLDAAAADAGAQAEGVVLDLRHRLGAAGHDDPGAPVATWPAAYSTACSPDPQRRSTWTPGTPVPRPASSAAIRPIAGASPLG